MVGTSSVFRETQRSRTRAAHLCRAGLGHLWFLGKDSLELSSLGAELALHPEPPDLCRPFMALSLPQTGKAFNGF